MLNGLNLSGFDQDGPSRTDQLVGFDVRPMTPPTRFDGVGSKYVLFKIALDLNIGLDWMSSS